MRSRQRGGLGEISSFIVDVCLEMHSIARITNMLGLQPRDTAAMLDGNTIQFIFSEFA